MAGDLGWAQGRLGIFGEGTKAANATNDTRIVQASEADNEDPLGDFYDQLNTCVVVLSIVLFVQLFGIWWWRTSINAKYYERQASRPQGGYMVSFSTEAINKASDEGCDEAASASRESSIAPASAPAMEARVPPHDLSCSQRSLISTSAALSSEPNDAEPGLHIQFLAHLAQDSAEHRARRIAWISFYVHDNDHQKALDLGWDGKPFRVPNSDHQKTLDFGWDGKPFHMPPPSPPPSPGPPGSLKRMPSSAQLRRQSTVNGLVRRGASFDNLLNASVGVYDADRPREFIPLPASLCFPNLFTFAFGLLLTGVLETSIAVLSSIELRESRSSGRWQAVLVLVFIVCYTLLFLLKIVHLYVRHRSEVWQAEEPLAREAAYALEDPLMKFLQLKVGARITTKTGLVDRSRGEFSPPDKEVEEPARTERMLASPFRIFPSVSADALDQLGLYLGRATGDGILGITYDWVAQMVQLIIVALTALNLEEGSGAAHTQVVAITILQLGLGIWTIFFGLSVDRIEGLTTASQFILEGTATWLLLAGGMENQAFILLITSVLLPVVVLLYDTLIVTIIGALLSKEKISCKTCLESAWAIGLAAFGVVYAFLGIDPPGTITSVLENVDAVYAEEQEGVQAIEKHAKAQLTGSSLSPRLIKLSQRSSTKVEPLSKAQEGAPAAALRLGRMRGRLGLRRGNR